MANVGVDPLFRLGRFEAFDVPHMVYVVEYDYRSRSGRAGGARSVRVRVRRRDGAMHTGVGRGPYRFFLVARGTPQNKQAG